MMRPSNSYVSPWILFTIILTIITSLCTAQQVRNVGKFHSFAHDVDSDQVTILNEKTIQIKNFTYDGTGPAAWFVLGRGQDYRRERVQLKGLTIIPDENESCGRLKKYNGQSFQLTLPDTFTFNQFDYLSIYCIDFRHNFGYIRIPNNLNVAKSPATHLRECKPRIKNSGLLSNSTTTASSNNNSSNNSDNFAVAILRRLATRVIHFFTRSSSFSSSK